MTSASLTPGRVARLSILGFGALVFLAGVVIGVS